MARVCLLALAWQVMPAWAADPDLFFKRSTAPGQVLVQSIDEQPVGAAEKERMRENARLLQAHKIIPRSEYGLPFSVLAELQFRARGKPFSRIVGEKRLTFSPANVDATSLKGHGMPEALVAGIYMNKAYTGLSRMFRPPGLGYVILDEYDLVTPGGGAILTKESITADINGAPAVIYSEQGTLTSETRLMWFWKGMSYTLRAPGIDAKSRAELLNIARSISR